MKRYRTIVPGLLLVLLFAACRPSMAADDTQDFIGLITGELRSTAHQVGMDLKAMATQANLHLAIYNSSGAVENIYAVYQRPGTHLGFVQSDVLAFVAKVESDPRLALIAQKIKWVYPLYDQEVHILARPDIPDLAALNGRSIAIGDPQSGSYLTSRLILEIAGVKPRSIQPIGGDAALDALKRAAVDAMVIVDGMPTERLVLDVSPMDGLHLVPVTHSGIRAFYPACRIPSGTYPWQTGDVETVSVRNVLVAYDFHNRHCDTIGTLAQLIRDNMAWLRINGHPKWKRVDLDATVSGWDQYSCVTDYSPWATIDAEGGPDREPNPVAEAIQAMFRP
jgi:uncharacterized protein